MLIDVIEWLGTIVSVVGAYANARGKRNSFLLWGVGNVFFIFFAAHYEHWGFLSLQVTYLAINAIGYTSWSGNAPLKKNAPKG